MLCVCSGYFSLFSSEIPLKKVFLEAIYLLRLFISFFLGSVGGKNVAIARVGSVYCKSVFETCTLVWNELNSNEIG